MNSVLTQVGLPFTLWSSIYLLTYLLPAHCDVEGAGDFYCLLVRCVWMCVSGWRLVGGVDAYTVYFVTVHTHTHTPTLQLYLFKQRSTFLPHSQFSGGVQVGTDVGTAG